LPERFAKPVATERIARLAAGSAASSVSPFEDRRELRRTTALSAALLLDRVTEVACIVRDVSDSGARVSFDMDTALPAQVVLIVGRNGRRRRARVVWQREREAGLSFRLQALEKEKNRSGSLRVRTGA
jgi:hypothetical protein